MNAQIMEVKKARNNVWFVVSDREGVEYNAIQLVSRGRTKSDRGRLYANERIEEGDQVLVCEVPHFVSNARATLPPEEYVSHIIVGIVPPSVVQNIASGLRQTD